MQSLSSLMRYKPATVMLHLALTTILVGACVTHFFGEQGEIHLRADKAETLTIHTPYTIHHTPSLSLFLWDFQVVEDPQTHAPADYITELRLLDRSKSEIRNHKSQIVVDEGTIRMNHPLIYHHWRFCQSNFDSDQLGVTLRYNYDPWGIGITYTGYALLLIALIAFFFQRRSYFRAILKKSLVFDRSGLNRRFDDCHDQSRHSQATLATGSADTLTGYPCVRNHAGVYAFRHHRHQWNHRPLQQTSFDFCLSTFDYFALSC